MKVIVCIMIERLPFSQVSIMYVSCSTTFTYYHVTGMLFVCEKDELILKDPMLTDKECPHRMRADFVNDLNTVTALSAHGPM